MLGVSDQRGRVDPAADDQLVAGDDLIAEDCLSRLTEPAGFLTVDEMQSVDEALALVLDL